MRSSSTAADPASMPWPEARALAGTVPKPLPPVTVGLDVALGATLAAPLHALSPLPTVDTAAMDGFAVAGAGPWTLAGQIRAGEPAPEATLAEGECLEVATGAPLPPGVEAVLPYERASHQGGAVSGCANTGQHVRTRAEDCAQDTALVPAGRIATPAVLGLAAGVGHDHLEVIRRPEVRILITGDELLSHGPPAGGRVRDAIGPMLPGLIAPAGGVPGSTRRLADDRQALRDALTEAGGDVVIVSGGSSAGPADHVRALLAELDAEVLVGSVACRPGHPQLLARLPDGRWVLGLPGNPFAALAAVGTLLLPLLTAFAGRTPPAPEYARLAYPVEPHPRDTRLISVRCSGGTVDPVGHDRAGLLWGAALADALAVIPPGSSGSDVELLRLAEGGGSMPARTRR